MSDDDHSSQYDSDAAQAEMEAEANSESGKNRKATRRNKRTTTRESLGKGDNAILEFGRKFAREEIWKQIKFPTMETFGVFQTILMARLDKFTTFDSDAVALFCLPNEQGGRADDCYKSLK